jgi:hypothetical protein
MEEKEKTDTSLAYRMRMFHSVIAQVSHLTPTRPLRQPLPITLARCATG